MKHFIKIIFAMVLSLSCIQMGYSQLTVDVHSRTSPSMYHNEGAEWLAELATDMFMTNPNSINLAKSKRASFNCMAMNVFNEAQGEDLMGKKLVASVVMVRANEQHKSVCQIIYAPHQFSWTRSKKASQHFHQISHSVHTHTANVMDTQAYRDSIYSAFYTVIFNGTPVTNADYYHTTSIHTKWDKKMKMVKRHGHHVFYHKLTSRP